MAVIKVGINGFGRIGRRVFRLLLQHPDIEVVAINDIADTKTLSHLLKYDSIHGVLQKKVAYTTDSIKVDQRTYPFYSQTSISKIPWQGVDIVIEATGKFKTKSAVQTHISSGAKKVILCVPPTDDQIKMIVAGVNDSMLTPEDRIISNASCTTNNAAPILKLIHDAFEIQQAYITTVHSYTTDQSLHDQPHKDLRRARAAGQSIVPTTTGAAKALTKLFPDLNTVIGGCGIRVPVANGSLCDITLNVKRETSIQAVNSLFENAANGSLKGILQYTKDSIVSVDIVGNPHSCVLDSEMTSVIGKMIKIIAWYDNETGYSSRIIDLVYKISRK
ncbi:MAG: type I glyceraldehyde-3-phosphate dehydrogenase [Patiriisocius sp.]